MTLTPSQEKSLARCIELVNSIRNEPQSTNGALWLGVLLERLNTLRDEGAKPLPLMRECCARLASGLRSAFTQDK